MAGFTMISLGRTPFAAVLSTVRAKVELRTFLCAVAVCAVVLLIAYLTNPSENSFRTYLTEQSFRQHLSRLDYNNEDEDCSLEDSIRVNGHYSPKRTSSAPSLAQDNITSPFHFANRASVSLRTPKHVFHTFGMFTIAAMLPLANPSADRDGSMMADSWFIGAFGRWWRGGVVETWYHDVIARTKDEEAWTSGIMGIKALDKLQEFNGLPFASKTTPPRALTRGAPPKLRNRERSAQRLGVPPARSCTPPPLPKSASLPLHTTRLPTSSHDQRNSTQPVERPASQSPLTLVPVSAEVRLGSLSRSPSGLFEHSPLIQEVLRQINLSKSTTHDLREQLSTLQSDSSTAHETLQNELDSCRERRRVEDASRLEFKSRTKTLEDTKRSAESTKREAEKRLKAAHSARDNANQRREHLDKEIIALQARIVEDGDKVHTDDGSKREAADALSKKRQEIKVAEDVVGVLGVRAKEFEDRIASELERLQRARERFDLRKQDESFYPLHITNSNESNPAWAHSYSAYDASHSLATDFDGATKVGSNDHSRTSSGSSEAVAPSRPPRMSLGSLSNFNLTHPDSNAITMRAKGYSIFDDDIASLNSQHSSHSQQQHSSFSPFGDVLSGGMVSPMSSSLIPSSLIQSLDGSSENLSRSFQSESDPFMDREWRSPNIIASNHDELNASPVSLMGPSLDDPEHDPFEVRHHCFERQTSQSMMEMQRAGMPSRAHSDPTTVLDDDGFGSLSSHRAEKAPGGGRRWFSPRANKGLNPDAKVFSLNLGGNGKRSSASTLPSFSVTRGSRSSFDALNPTTGNLLGLGNGSTDNSSSSSNSLLRAFAPSPAEREALQRALGGSTNTSLERLPSLSDVSIPSSPVLLQRSVLPAWLQSLPRIRKPNFSPWDDDEPPSSATR